MNTLVSILNNVYNVAIYIRLSKEDEKIGESESITNQRSLLLKYVKENNYNLIDIYIDDGFSGTNFNRPAFIRMLQDIEKGKINMVITKDMSRLGRDYIGTGEYIEKWFPAHNVRYIAVTDNIDTAIDNTNNDIAPFKAIMNDYYAKDISKKIKASLKTKQEDGKWVGGCPPFGYKIDPDDKNHLIPNEKEAPIVKKIFELASNGMSAYAIKEYLTENDIPTTSMIRGKRGSSCSESIKGYWNCKTIKGILTNQLYTGDLVQNRRNKLNYKIKKIVNVPKEKWIIVEDTHEALVDKKTFESIGHMLPKMSNRANKEIIRLLDGLLYCHECGHKITICKPRKSDGRTYIVCNYYRMNSKRKECTSHGFNYDALEDGILKIIKDVCNKVLKADDLSKRITPKCKENDPKEIIETNILKYRKEIEKDTDNLDKMYLDKLEGKVTEEMFNRLSYKLTENIDKLKVKLEELLNIKEKINDEILTSMDCEKLIIDFLKNKKPTREMILKLVSKIEIHKDKQIDIYFNFKELNFLLTTS